MKKTIIALLCLGGIAFGTDATLSWSVDCTNGQYSMLTGSSPLSEYYCSSNFIQGSGVQTSGTAADGSGIALTSQLQTLQNEFSLVLSLASVTTTFNADATAQQLTLVAMKKSDGYTFSVRADSQTGIITLDLGNAEASETCNNLALIGNNTTEAQTITLTFSNVEGSSNALVSVYLDDKLATSAEMWGGWRTSDSVSANLLTGFGRAGVAAVVSQVSYYNGALTQAQISQLIPEPATATLSLLALAGLAVRRRRK
jgi:hypothetical protein